MPSAVSHGHSAVAPPSVRSVPKAVTLDVLHTYAWASGEPDPAEELAFMDGQYGDPAIDDWLVVLPADGRSGA